MLTMILRSFICQNLSFFSFRLDWVGGGGRGIFGSLTHLSPTPSGRSFTSFQFLSERQECLKHETVVECKRILCNNLVFKNEFYCSFKQKT